MKKATDGVAPFAGAWIEIRAGSRFRIGATVAPFAGAWIEIIDIFPCFYLITSLPSRGRGLKSKY